MSIHSHHSESLALPNETDETVTVIETEADPKSQPSPDLHSIDIVPAPNIESIKLDDSTDSIKTREISIGSVYDQFLVEYVVRLICYKFLLAGQDQKLKLDNVVRVSIKNLSLIVLSNCVRIYPQILLMKLAVARKEYVSDECVDAGAAAAGGGSDDDKLFDDLSELLAEKTERKGDELLLDIIPDHFGTSTCSLDEFLSPLTESGSNPLTSTNEKSKGPSKVTVMANLTVNEAHDFEVADKCDQNIEDVLLYFNHHDPSLRGNVQTIVGNFIVSVLEDHRSVEQFRKTFAPNFHHKFISFDLMLKVLLQVTSIECFCLFLG